jgi:hypothetical protein
MPRIVATPHRMMPAHEVDLMAGIARADVDGFSIRGQHIAGTGESAASRAAGGGGVGATGIACGTGAGRRGRRRRLARHRDGTNGLRQVGKLLRYGLRPGQSIRLPCRLDWLRWRLHARPKLMMKCCNSRGRARGQHCAKDSSRGVHSGSSATRFLGDRERRRDLLSGLIV